HTPSTFTHRTFSSLNVTSTRWGPMMSMFGPMILSFENPISGCFAKVTSYRFNNVDSMMTRLELLEPHYSGTNEHPVLPGYHSNGLLVGNFPRIHDRYAQVHAQSRWRRLLLE